MVSRVKMSEGPIHTARKSLSLDRFWAIEFPPDMFVTIESARTLFQEYADFPSQVRGQRYEYQQVNAKEKRQ
jgi:hypothetical protein